MADITIISGSASDDELVKKVERALKDFNISCESFVASAHRNPDKVREIVQSSNAKLFIGIAGLSAALPGTIAAYTTRPVIGLPRNVKLDGIDSFLSMLQMPPGVPVATVGVDSATNAALLAAQILAVSDERIKKQLEELLGR